ncbi:MAG: hypothetical protein AAFO75_13550, partial [Pseudomonadota bacterium]
RADGSIGFLTSQALFEVNRRKGLVEQRRVAVLPEASTEMLPESLARYPACSLTCWSRSQVRQRDG